MTKSIPSIATVVASLVAGALAVLNQVVFHFGGTWHGYVTVILIFLAGLGISPLTGSAFRSALHLPHAVVLAVTAALAALQVGLTTVHISSTLHGIIVAAIAVLAGLGFGSTVPSNSIAVTPPVPASGVVTPTK